MNITKETIGKLNELGYSVFGRKGYKTTDEGLHYNQAEYLVVVLETNDDFVIKNFKTPKEKEVTVDWVLSKINKESCYRNLSEYLRNVFEHSVFIYPASYGVGVDTLGGYKMTANEVSAKLKELGLKYRTELSEAGWVYRFIVSKDSENMKILESLESLKSA